MAPHGPPTTVMRTEHEHALTAGTMNRVSLTAFDPTAIVASAVTLATVVVADLGLRRKQSGRIKSTDADRLWSEAERMRQHYEDELARLRTESLAQIKDVIGLREQVVGTRIDADHLRADGLNWKTEALDYRNELAAIRDDILVVRDEVRAGRFELAATRAGALSRRADAAMRRHAEGA